MAERYQQQQQQQEQISTYLLLPCSQPKWRLDELYSNTTPKRCKRIKEYKSSNYNNNNN